MAATAIATGFLSSHLMLLFCTAAATATATLPGFPAVVINGAAPPAAPATDVGGGGLGPVPKLPIPFSGGQPKLPITLPGGGLPRFPFPVPGGIPQLPFPFPGNGNNPVPVAGADCLNAVRQAEGCVGDVLRSLVSSSPSPVEDAVRAGGKACCAALQAVGDRCFRGVLPVSPFRALYAPLVQHACGGGLLPGGMGPLVPGGPRV